MSIYEYNEEYMKKTLYEDGFDNGLSKGRQEGISVNLVKNVEALMCNLHFSLEQACEALGITTADYEKAREEIRSDSRHRLGKQNFRIK